MKYKKLSICATHATNSRTGGQYQAPYGASVGRTGQDDTRHDPSLCQADRPEVAK